jgi:Uma2 family endonuclease
LISVSAFFDRIQIMLLDFMKPKSGVRGPHRFTMEEYLHLAEIGFFGDQRVEFIEGEIIDMAPQHNPHAFVITVMGNLLTKWFPPDRFWVRSQATFKVLNSLPEPDLAVLVGPPDPRGLFPESAILIVEISDTTLAADSKTKANLYAAGGIEDYWIVNIPGREVLVHRNPAKDESARFGWKYQSITRVAPGESVAPLAMPDALIDPAQILP